MDVNMKGLLENLKNKKLNYELDLVLEGGAMNGAFEIGGLILLKQLEMEKKIKINRISGASVGAFTGLLYLTDRLDSYISHYKEWRNKFNETVKLDSLKTLLMTICSELTSDEFKSLQKDKLFINYYDVKTRRCILKKEYVDKKDLWETVLKSCHLPYLINGEIFYKTEEGEYLDGGLPYIFKLQRENVNHRVFYMKLTQADRIGAMFNVAGEENMDGRILEGLLDTYNFLMYGKKTNMCSFVNDWSYFELIPYNCIDYIYYFLVCFLIFYYRLFECVSPKLEKSDIYIRFKPLGNQIYKSVIRYLVFG